MSIRVGEGSRVTLAYRLQTERGDVLEERTPENPFEFVFGSGQTLPAIENVIRGKTEGFTASLGVAAKEAYGEFDDQLVATVSIASFPKPEEVQVGMKFTTLGPGGEELAVRVVEVLEDQVTVDGNHPLAGVDIEIDLKILGVEPDGQNESEKAGSDSESGNDSDSGGRILH
jgi:FKBP-type peptidyl-prolyl cis-trans isomerase SlyD